MYTNTPLYSEYDKIRSFDTAGFSTLVGFSKLGLLSDSATWDMQILVKFCE